MYSVEMTTQAPDPCKNITCANNGICTAISDTAYVCQCNSSKCGQCEYLLNKMYRRLSHILLK
jgi:hypothetical protein